MEHPIAAYLRKHDRTQRELLEDVARVGGRLSKTHLSQILSGKRGVRPKTAELLSRALRGRVKPNEIIFWKKPATGEAA